MTSTHSNMPFSQACENNKKPILAVIQPLFENTKQILEVGSGTGQHGLYFAQNMPHLTWQCSDRPMNLPGINMRLASTEKNVEQPNNTPTPIALDLFEDQWPKLNIDAIFSANAVHIMPWAGVEILFKAAGYALAAQGQLVLYGPFNYEGQYSSASNARFDQWLKSQHPESAIRDFEAINQLALNAGMSLRGDYEMPANNRVLHWVKD
ncbi:MAG: DUF938 domain-containing protein [Pseudomonadales bacterium]|nr:DUF938 domain-containing protein [Pseudomonadales bacterium]